MCFMFYVLQGFYRTNIAGTSSEMTRRQSRRIISKERRRVSAREYKSPNQNCDFVVVFKFVFSVLYGFIIDYRASHL